MRRTTFMALAVVAAFAASACKNNVSGPAFEGPITSTGGSTGGSSGTIIYEAHQFVGTWKATQAEAWDSKDRSRRRDLVAEGGEVILTLEANSAPGRVSGSTYTITVQMPGKPAGVSKGVWHYHEAWGKPQIDFYSEYLLSLPNLEFGEVPSFFVALKGDGLNINDGGGEFLPYDFGWDVA